MGEVPTDPDRVSPWARPDRTTPLPSLERPLVGDYGRRAPTALVLGALAGVLAAVAILPTILPLTQRVAAAEQSALLAQTLAAGRAASVLLEHDMTLRGGVARRLGVDGVEVLGFDGAALLRDGDLPDLPLATMCPPGEPPGRLVTAREQRWAVACEHAGTSLVITARRPERDPARSLGYLVAALACMVGISTAFGVLQVLSPLTRIKEGLGAVAEGTRGVRVATTGLAELDELVNGVNAAARAVEDREDAIRGRIQVVQELARVVAHEVRNPLQSLEFQTSLIAAEEDASARNEIAASIREEVRVLESVVTRMLGQGAQALHPVRSEVSVADLVQKVVTFHRSRARHHGIRLDVGHTTPTIVDADRPLLTRAVENLVTNAIEQSPTTVIVSAHQTATHVVITVEDDGPGVSETLGEAIWQPGVTGREGGWGLGLSLVHGVVTAHDGSVEFGRSSLGGAMFRLALPRTPAAPATSPPPESG